VRARSTIINSRHEIVERGNPQVGSKKGVKEWEMFFWLN